ncbi:helix-turn-helix domain-containing protein [Paenibacillus sp. NRS-1782]|uniref:helix-turn-helix domain-containing protein n=1 Tax=unclassified Paenibacillus TaxID=185978 RepID=UPI003D2A01EE
MYPNRIRQMRRLRNLTGGDVAEHLGISSQYYYNIERGRRKLSADHASKLAQMFRVTVDFLLGEPIPDGETFDLLTPEMYADGHTDESYLKDLEKILEKNETKKLNSEEHEEEELTLAAHHDGEDWTDEELEEIEQFKEFVKLRRKQRSKE